MSEAHDRGRASLAALAVEAPGAVLGSRPRARRARKFRPVGRGESPEERAARGWAALAAEAPGAVLGSVGCPCPLDRRVYRSGPVDTVSMLQRCPVHGERVRRVALYSGLANRR